MTVDDQPQTVATNNSPESPDRPLKIAKYTQQHHNDEPQAAEVEEEENQTMGQNPRTTIQRYLVAIEYIGTRFSGAQQQAPNCRTVVGALQVFQPFFFFLK